MEEKQINTESDFYYSEYEYIFPTEECEFIGRLEKRKKHFYNQCPSMLCFFTTAEGRKIVLSAFPSKFEDKALGAKNSEADFANDVQDYSIWRCRVVCSKYGKLYWESAELVSDIENPDTSFCYRKIQTMQAEEIEANIIEREARKAARKKKREELEYRHALKENSWFGRRLRLVKSFREGTLSKKHMKEYASRCICFVMSSDRTTMCCPRGCFFKTHDVKGKAKIIYLPSTCQECEVSGCLGTYQKSLQLSYDKVTSFENYLYSKETDDEH